MIGYIHIYVCTHPHTHKHTHTHTHPHTPTHTRGHPHFANTPAASSGTDWTTVSPATTPPPRRSKHPLFSLSTEEGPGVEEEAMDESER
jgi:hypothetical protein